MRQGHTGRASSSLEAFRDTLGEQWGWQLAWKPALQPCLSPPSAESQQVVTQTKQVCSQ